jgi:PAS domain S-box-containing protein
MSNNDSPLYKRLKKEVLEKPFQYLDLLGSMIVVINRDHKVEYVNRRGCEILGYKKEEIIGQDWFSKFLHIENQKEVVSVFDKLISGEIEPVEHYENPVIDRKGNEKYIFWHNTVLRDEEGIIIGTISSGEDITKLKKLSEDLEQKRDTIEGILKAAPIGIGMAQNRMFKFVNDRLCEMTGYSREELLGKDSRMIFESQKEYDRVGKERHRQIEKEKRDIGKLDAKIKTKGGKVKVVVVSIAPLEKGNLKGDIIFTMIDITKRMSMEEELHQKLEKLEKLNKVMIGREIKMAEMKKKLGDQK